MDLPVWSVWIVSGMAVLQALALVPVIRRSRDPDPLLRSKARIDLLETAGSLVALTGFLLTFVVAEFWSVLALVGFGLMSAAYVMKGLRLLRVRRRRPRDGRG
ncbi:hypothetical protein ABZ615_00710 [Streptomyces sp. NPDC007325]|uniref:hypothetical protein n=1 Tax=Streptomyces sp. NPDC007325 TaxID=3154588 RepID=UPI0033DA67A8